MSHNFLHIHGIAKDGVDDLGTVARVNPILEDNNC
jgi:hypothetical protein